MVYLITYDIPFAQNKNSEFCAPLTAFDWNETDPTTLGTSSIDTTCTIWNIEVSTIYVWQTRALLRTTFTTQSCSDQIPNQISDCKKTQTQQAKTQLIAHDKEVYDIAFARGTDVFASVGADGSLRMFDLRNLEHSPIIYETPELTPLLRLSWNKQDPKYLAAIPEDSNNAIILDIRVPSVPAAELSGHAAAINALAWAPHSSCHLCTASDDKQAYIWDLSTMPKPIEDPILAYSAESEVNQLQWSSSQPDWISITFGNKMQILRV